MDSSVWVDFFSSKPGRGGGELRRMIEESEPFALTGVVVAEVLQGLTRDSSRIEGFLAQWDMLEPQGFETYRQAAAMYRAARARGVSLTTIDTLIAASPWSTAPACLRSTRIFPELRGSPALDFTGSEVEAASFPG